MNFKILQHPKAAICLHRDRSESGDEIVRITAFVTSSAGMELMLEKVVRFFDAQSAKCFVEDYSDSSADSFLAHCIQEERVQVVYALDGPL